jgi:hypothetical protein
VEQCSEHALSIAPLESVSESGSVSAQDLESFRPKLTGEHAHARHVAAWSTETGHGTEADWLATAEKTTGIVEVADLAGGC